MATVPPSSRTLPSNRGLRELIAPHRSYRRLPVSRSGALLTIPAVLVVEIAVFLLASWCQSLMTAFGAFVAARSGIDYRVFPDPFLYVTTHPMTFAMRHSDWIELCGVIVVCLLVILALSIWTAIAAPIRFFINLNALLVGGAAVYLLLRGHLGYDSAAFTQLMLRTALLTWLIMPLFVGLFASLFPFTFLERLIFIGITVAYDVPLSIARYGLFVAILGSTSSIAMTDLYLVFGPLLDAVPIICFFSLFLVRVAKKMEERRAVWGWL